jgi:integrase/recombinase XerD
MKKEYPNYRRSGVEFIENKLQPKEKKILKDFLTYCSIHAGDKKVREYRICILQVRDIIEKPYDKITLEDLREFLSVLNKGYQRGWTKQGIKVCLKKFLKWYYPDWSLRFNQLEDIKLGSPTTQDKINSSTLPTSEEIEILIRSAERLRDKAYLSLSFECACRPDEIVHLKWKDIAEDFTRVTLFSGKKKESRTLPCNNSQLHLKRWYNEFCYPNVRKEDFVFPSPTSRIKPISVNASWYLIKKLSKKVGIEKNLYGYLMRHARLNQLYKQLPEQVHKKFAGHSKDSRMPRVYEHLNNEDMLQVILDKVYNVKELTTDQKNIYEKKLLKQSKVIEGLIEILEINIEILEINNKDKQILDKIQKIKHLSKKLNILKLEGKDKPSNFN